MIQRIDYLLMNLLRQGLHLRRSFSAGAGQASQQG